VVTFGGVVSVKHSILAPGRNPMSLTFACDLIYLICLLCRITCFHPHACRPQAAAVDVVLSPAYPTHYPELLAVLALSGLANRDRPTLWLNSSSPSTQCCDVPVMWPYVYHSHPCTPPGSKWQQVLHIQVLIQVHHIQVHHIQVLHIQVHHIQVHHIQVHHIQSPNVAKSKKLLLKLVQATVL
jgi:hypothetical protein